MTEQRFITTGPGRNYHHPDCTTGFHSRRAVNAEKGRTIHPILHVTEAEALAANKKPCGNCVGRA
ncbi:hypothetical protein AB0O22_09410 [Streptomyces sp. NPDC091204]|uniref:hypothetical protein n=1 Tax=Streptomyces sp. NPDC091204 TaxID=3155299 RepID=UPI003424D99D